MIALLIKSSVVIALLLAFYKLVLEKESFFSKNRWYLIGCLVLAFVLPFITLPQLVPDQGIVSTTIEKIAPAPQSKPIATVENVMESDEIFDQTEVTKIAIPTKEMTNQPEKKSTISIAKTEAAANAPVITKPITVDAKLGWIEWLLLIYFFGVLIFTLHLLTQTISLIWQIIKSTDRIEDTDCTIINMPGVKEPCSFFSYIFINPETYDYDTYEQILAHERIHVKQRHTIDLLFSEIVAIALWFNPLVWLFRMEVEKNLEYQTDELLLRQKAAEKEVYQMNLVKIATHNKPLTVTTNYNQSLIKQRILKMNTQKSNPHSYWKYAFIAPMIFGIVLILNKPNSVFAASDLSDEIGVMSDESAENEATTESGFEKIIDNSMAKPVDNHNGKIPETIPSDKEESACAKLEKAVKNADVEAVRAILMRLDPACFPKVETADYENFELLRSVVNDYSEIFINPKSGSIMIKYWATTIYDGTLGHLHYEDQRDFDKGIDIKCDELLKAEKEMDFKKLKLLYLTMTSDCLNEPSAEDLRHLKYMKFLLNNGAKMSIEPKTITINTQSLLGTGDGENGSNITVSKSEKKYSSSSNIEFNGSYQAFLKSGFPQKEGSNNTINWTSMENYEILENLDHMTNFQDLSDQEKSAVLKVLKDDEPTLELLEDYQILIDGNNLNGKEAAEIEAVVEHILDKTIGQKSNTPNLNDKTPCKSLLKAVSQQNISELKKLLKYYDPNCSCESSETFRQNEKHQITITGNQTPLVNAARIGNVVIGKILVDNGADTDFHAEGEASPLEAAKQYGNVDFVKLLQKEESVFESFFGTSKKAKCKELVNAIGIESVSDVKRLLKLVDANCTCKNSDIYLQVDGGNFHESRSPLVTAARTGVLKIGQILIDAGADVEMHVRGDESALMAASTSGNLDFVKLLVEKGANVNKKISGDGTALLVASRKGHVPVVKYLISKGAKVDAVVRGDGTALINAVRSNHYEVAKLLLENGAQPTLAARGDDNPVYHARRNGNRRMIDLLIEYDK